MSIPIVTTELADRIDKSEIAYMLSDLSVLSGGNNPFSVDTERFGEAVGFRMGAVKDWEFNRVLGLRDASDSELDGIVDWYRGRGGPCYLDLIPMLTGRHLRENLASRGFYQDTFHTALYCVPSTNNIKPREGLVVKEVGKADIGPFSDLYMVYMDDLGLSKSLRRSGETLVKTGYPRAGWRLYMVTIEGESAAFGMLHIEDGIASMAGAATVKKYRGWGCQTALINRRLEDAAVAGCNLAVTQAAPGSVSQRNMERVGFRVAYTKAIWSNVYGD